MNFTKDEKLAIIYACWSLAYEDYDFSIEEQKFIERKLQEFEMLDANFEEVRNLRLSGAIGILKTMSYEKKEEVRIILQKLAEADGKVLECEFNAIIKLVNDIHQK